MKNKLFLVLIFILVYSDCIGINSNLELLLNLAKRHKINKMQESNKNENPDNDVVIDKSVKAYKIDNPPTNQDAVKLNDIKDSAIYYQGWIKYFRFKDDKKTEKPKHFFKNSVFEKQAEVKTDIDKVIEYKLVGKF
jgi:hypothetical protein